MKNIEETDPDVVKDRSYYETYKAEMDAAMKRFLWFVVLVAISFSIVWLLQKNGFVHSALLYIGTPIVLSLISYSFGAYDKKPKNLFQASLDTMLVATFLIFSSSIILQEGWICILILLPIFYLSWSVAFVVRWLYYRKHLNKKLKAFSFALPVLALLASLEGVFPQTTFERYQIVQHSSVTDQSVDELKANLTKQLEFSGDRHWFLKLFPLPDAVHAGTLEEGDVHKLDFTYWRWFFTHEHRGSLYVKLKEVNDDHIITEITKNTSFYARYLDIKNTRIDFDVLQNGNTKVTLHIGYERKLDPYWYFGPMQRFAVSKAAEVIVNDIIVGENNG